MVSLVSMTEADFQDYYNHALQDYAQEHVKAGNWHLAEALQRAEQELRQLLPNGLASENQHLFSIEDEKTGTKVGLIWFAVDTKRPMRSAFIYDFVIFSEYRRQGYGTEALMVLEEKVEALDIEAISLHVFGHNHAAQALYKKMGYEITGIHMAKKLNAPSR